MFSIAMKKNLIVASVAAVLLVMGTAAGTDTRLVSPSLSIAANAADVKDISSAKYLINNKTPDEAVLTYTGKELKPTVKFTFDDGTSVAVSTTNFDIQYENNINAGTAKMTVTGKGTKYSGSQVIYYTISPKSLTSTAVTFSESTFSYTGTSITPDVTVKDGTTILDASSYDVSYKDNINAGKGIAVVTFKSGGNYSGTIEKTFTIKASPVPEENIRLARDSYTYSGSVCTPSVMASNGTKLTKDDYSVSYSNNIKVGTATAKITFKRNYSGSISKTFTIEPANGTQAIVSGVGPQVYTGKAITPEPTISYRGVVLKKNTDYTLTYLDNTELGTAKIVIDYKGNYTGSKTINFTIRPMDVMEAEISFASGNEYEYTGKEITPKLIVKRGTTTLKEGTDYTVYYRNNVNVGPANAYVTIDSSTRTIPFTITKGTIKNTTSTIRAGYNHGAAPIADFKVQNSAGVYLTEGVDFEVSYNTTDFKVSKDPLTATIRGINNYEGETTRKVYIDARKITADMVTLLQDSFVYDGNAVTPSVSIYDGNIELKEGVDYELSYANNTKVGKGRVTVKGLCDYTGSCYLNFDIITRSMENQQVSVVVNNGNPVLWNLGYLPSSIVVSVNGTELKRNVDYTITGGDVVYTEDGIPEAQYYIITFKGNYSGTYSGKFAYQTTPFNNATIECEESLPYNGQIQYPNIKITAPDGYVLQEDVDYTVTRQANSKDPGYYFVGIRGIDNYAGSYIQKNYYISQELTYSNVDTIPDWNYTGRPVCPYPVVRNNNGQILSKGIDYTVTYKDNIEIGKATVIIEGIGKYSGVIERTFEIKIQSLESATVYFSPSTAGYSGDGVIRYAYTGKEIIPNFTLRIGTKVLQEGSDYTIDYVNNTNVGEAKMILTGRSGYDGVLEVPFYIAARISDNATVSLPQGYVYVSNGNEVFPEPTVMKDGKELLLGTDYVLQYGGLSGFNKLEGTSSKSTHLTIQGEKFYYGRMECSYRIVYGDFNCVALVRNGQIILDDLNVFVENNYLEDTFGNPYTYEIIGNPTDYTVKVRITLNPEYGGYGYTGTLEKDIPLVPDTSTGVGNGNNWGSLFQ